MFPNFFVQGSAMESIKEQLLRALIPIFNSTLGSEQDRKRNFQACLFNKNTINLSAIATDKSFKTNKNPLNCNTRMQKR